MRHDLPQTHEVVATKPLHAHGRLTQLDGLRAIAVMLVFLVHSTDEIPIGWVGVHLFFVLSGFLITSILWSARKDEFYWTPFYIKRATRILPPLIPFFIACSFVGAIPWRMTSLAYIFFGANIIQTLPNAPTNELMVLWSLAVEEHFYFLWPFAVRYLPRRSLILLLLSIILVEPIARALATHHVVNYVPIYMLTWFQLDGLAAGALLALLVQHEGCLGWLRRYAGVGALLLALVFAACSLNPAFVRERNTVIFNLFGYTLIVLTFALTLAHLLTKGQAWLSRLLSLRPMVFVGAVSYGVYLYSELMFDVLRWAIPITLHHRGIMGKFRLLLAFALTVLISWLSFRFYESPIVRWGRGKANALSVRGGRSMDAVQSASGEA